jgi:nickel-dependent lactate racemase
MRCPENGPANARAIAMHVSLKYGKGSVGLEIPKDRLLGVVKPKPSVRRGRSISEALAAPIGTEALPKLVDRNNKVAVVVSDISRVCPTRTILPFIMRSLKMSGVPRDNVRILIGTGTHRGHTAAEKRTLLGPYASSITKIVDHSMDSVQYVGTTKRGTKVSVNSLLLDADFALAIGNVDVHYFAGYTGGYKGVVPALAGKETIERNHSLMTLPNAEPAVVESNPVREDLEEAGQMTGLRYVINVVQDERKRIMSSFAGDPIAAQRAAIKTVDDLVKAPVKESADIVVASAGGYPRDINLYQALKAIENASHAVKAGGTIILVAECREGFGNTTFESWMTRASSLEEVGEKLSKHFILGAHKAYALSKIAKRAEIIVASNKLQASSIILRTCKKPQDALNDAWRSHGKDASILLMPYAMNTLPETPSDL